MLIYNIPAAKLNGYHDKAVIVRSDDDRALVNAFSAVPKENLLYLQVLSMDADADSLLHLSDSVPVDLVTEDPAAEFSQLYRFAQLPWKHPTRVRVRAVLGMTKTVKIAQALNFSVKLELNQPEAPLVDELLTLAEYYLRGSTVSRPIEPFHSLLLSFFGGRPTSLWKLQDEDPAVDRYVTDDGRVAFSKRLVSLGIPEDQFEGFLEQSVSTIRDTDECAACDFFDRCEGYFKLPDKTYQCEHIKRLFTLLNEAGMELRRDEERFVELYGRKSS